MPIDSLLFFPAVDEQHGFTPFHREKVFITQIAGFLTNCFDCAAVDHLFGKGSGGSFFHGIIKIYGDIPM